MWHRTICSTILSFQCAKTKVVSYNTYNSLSSLNESTGSLNRSYNDISDQENGIYVIVRSRPLSTKENRASEPSIVSFPGNGRILSLMITNAPFYVSNHTLHSDLNIQTVLELTKSFYKLFRSRLANHPNPLILVLDTSNIPGNPPRTLKRNWCRYLATIHTLSS
ncbi:kinesin-like protein KIF12 [Aphis craccivora]|uniref:Kinesin-like protein KIF12 n=1 Tax=Aphis craccivora TaxID=307492 RepID=A0A6G0ZF13_APHCR|nr:kinesin-like protein KIF12 [Aphis craccivora]